MGKVSGEDVKVQNLSFEIRKALARPPRFETKRGYRKGYREGAFIP